HCAHNGGQEADRIGHGRTLQDGSYRGLFAKTPRRPKDSTPGDQRSAEESAHQRHRHRNRQAVKRIDRTGEDHEGEAVKNAKRTKSRKEQPYRHVHSPCSHRPESGRAIRRAQPLKPGKPWLMPQKIPASLQRLSGNTWTLTAARLRMTEAHP